MGLTYEFLRSLHRNQLASGKATATLSARAARAQSISIGTVIFLFPEDHDDISTIPTRNGIGS